MQKKKDVYNDVVKLKLFPFSLRDHAKIWYSSLPRNSIDSWISARMLLLLSIFRPQKLFPFEIKSLISFFLKIAQHVHALVV